jgi:hypothetical protein
MPKKKQITITLSDEISNKIEHFSSSEQEQFQRAIEKSMNDFIADKDNKDNDRENFSSSKSISLDDFLKQGETTDDEFQHLKDELSTLGDIEFKVQDEQDEEKEKLKKTLMRYSNGSEEELDKIIDKSLSSLPASQREHFSSSSSSSSESSSLGYWDYLIEQNNKRYKEMRDQDLHRGL